MMLNRNTAWSCCVRTTSMTLCAAGLTIHRKHARRQQLIQTRRQQCLSEIQPACSKHEMVYSHKLYWLR
jgi:hypothetical protein